ncbi:hypothetical protein BD408DRAFT_476427 [Parasitella parasitica]|nr:hypothetical protein BD408DRAFT_476427 [Parasitella parasitica]
MAKYQQSYLENANYTPIKLVNAQQIALYECTKIQTAYLNNIKTHFGNRLRTLLNKLCEKKERAETIRKEMASNAFSEEAIKEAIRQKAYNPSVAKKGMPNVDILNESSKPKVQTFLSAYPENYKFKMGSIFYDVKANPENHFKAFTNLVQDVEAVCVSAMKTDYGIEILQLY